MVYQFSLTVPASTTQALPTRSRIKLPRGVVTGVKLYIPRGHFSLASLIIRHQEQQVWPNNPEGDFRGNAVLLDFDEWFETMDKTTEFVLEGWNRDTRYAHTFRVYFEISPPTPRLLATLMELLFGKVARGAQPVAASLLFLLLGGS